ncbi:SapC family protein [Thalassotalea sp. ND16A]|uniref:SapC family protein n=1 Tax=Thalassotalea sp. ND16A TaxID=1535422 RepID=UPI00051A846A|nr:SapC family protein [Thalassotalea sp. ND16A]KGJ89380.1 hypothetical protein ND16A_2273 [Thalassotalea sp. ND16A]
MLKLEKLDSASHQHTKVLPLGSIAETSMMHMVQTVPQEFTEIAQHFPIFFAKDPETGQFNLMALLGLNVDENLFVTDGYWQSAYIPLKIQTTPFFLIEETQQRNTEQVSKPALAIDVDSARVQQTQGEALFVQGRATQYLQTKATQLAQFVEGLRFNQQFIEALLAENLLEAVDLDIRFENGEQLNLQGLYTINKEMLVQVPTAAQQEFENLGYVKLITDIFTSMQQVEALISRKNQRSKNLS